MSGFDTVWLDLREPADNAARDRDLRQAAIESVVVAGDGVRVVDLGCGTGSTVRALAPQSSSWHWRLVDNDPQLLEEAANRLGMSGRVECLQADLSQLGPELFTGSRLVTASALFDLVSAEFLERLLHLLRERDIGLYTALNYDGVCSWDIAHEADALVVEAFNAHQRRDKGFGPALGPTAEPVLSRLAEEAGFKVLTGQSPWHLAGDQAELQRQFISGLANAAAETGRLDESVLEDWRRMRLEMASRSGCKVGHWDMLLLR
ncbi:class I SAM-dependent methyltransferase [Rhizobium sp. CFBP 13726]|uniref:class I SAM-dependent methyltransferase n=1 Tax=Rhizobium sp. CFBP 13726 TaxID=2775296 RepID=UPI0017854149|nr:class I SAM-dependent methyltransferase [Rhizobium sp. CFBP 13726]MBD8653391.1 class I SAM-dependent methyltransferase [Rhizobium sp. CFBP 13726]